MSDKDAAAILEVRNVALMANVTDIRARFEKWELELDRSYEILIDRLRQDN